MKLRTKIDVTYNKPLSGTVTGKIEGQLQDAVWMNNFNTIGANFTYNNAEGEVFHKNGFTIDGEQVETLYNAIKSSIPKDLNYRDTNRISFYLGFIFEMAQTFGIKTTDIEIVS